MIPIGRRSNSIAAIDLVAPKIIGVVVGVAPKMPLTIGYDRDILGDLASHSEELDITAQQETVCIGHVLDVSHE